MQNLKLLREERGLSQQKLADKFHLTQQSIYKYENSLAEPDITTLTQFANYFHTSIDYLVGNTECMDVSPPYIIDGEPPTASEVHHLVLYRHLPWDIRKYIDGLLENLKDT